MNKFILDMIYSGYSNVEYMDWYFDEIGIIYLSDMIKTDQDIYHCCNISDIF